MESNPIFEPINLLLLAENDRTEFQAAFVADLRSFSERENYEPGPDFNYSVEHITNFKAFYRDFRIISAPVIKNDDSQEEIFSKIFKIQEHFIEPKNLNAIIFLMQPDPSRYKSFLSLHLLNNFNKYDIAKIEKNIIFVFMHNKPVGYIESLKVDTELWKTLESIGVRLLHSKTFHYPSRLDKDLHDIFMQFLITNKKTVLVETFCPRKSVVGNEDVLDLLLNGLFVNEINIHYNKLHTLKTSKGYRTICMNENCLKLCCSCPEVKAKSDLGQCKALVKESTCSNCKCSTTNHEVFKHRIIEQKLSYGNKEEIRQSLITIIVTIDLFRQENNESQLYDVLKKRIDGKPCYSALNTFYEEEKASREKGITADDCIKNIRQWLPKLKKFIKFDDDFYNNVLSPEGNLGVKCQSE